MLSAQILAKFLENHQASAEPILAKVTTDMPITLNNSVVYQKAGSLYADVEYADILLSIPIPELINRADHVFDIVKQRHQIKP